MTTRAFLAISTSVTALNSLAYGGEPPAIIPLVLEGDIVEGVGAVTRIDNIAVNDLGNWLVEADTDQADTDADQVVLRDGDLLLREGDPLAEPAGASIDSFDSIVINDASDSAWNFFLDGTVGIDDDSGIYFNTTLIVQEGWETFIEGLSPGTTYRGFFDVKINNDMQWASVLTVDDPEIDTTVDRAIILFEDVIMGVTRTLVAVEGDILPGQTEAVTDFGTGPHQSSLNDAGDVFFFADLAGPTTEDGALYIWDGLLQSYDLVAQEGSASPIAGRSWSSLSSPEIDINNAGGIVYSGSLDGDSASNLLLVRNDEKFRQEGDASPAAIDFQLTSFGTGPVEVSDAGGVLWYGDWNDPDTDVDTAIFLDDTVLVQEGVTALAGSIVDTLRGIEDGYHMSDDGRYVIFEAILLDGREGAFLIDLGVACLGDVVPDGVVNVDDLLLVLASWGDCRGGCPADANGDGVVNVDDLLAVLAGWGPCP